MPRNDATYVLLTILHAMAAIHIAHEYFLRSQEHLRINHYLAKWSKDQNLLIQVFCLLSPSVLKALKPNVDHLEGRHW